VDDKHPVEQIAEACGGTITDGGILPDGSGFAVISMSLKPTHWIYQKTNPLFDAPPMPLKMGSGERATIIIDDIPSKDCLDAGADGARGVTMTREGFAEIIREAGRYAIKASTMHGQEMNFDPDAMVQNLVVGLLGYWTDNGLSSCDDWANPPRFRKEPAPKV